MKRILKNMAFLMLLVAIIVPINAKAELVNYSRAIINTNNYILDNNYSTRNRYIIFNAPNELNDSGVLVTNTNFTNGSMLSKKEYELSVSNGKSYLSPGVEYWTLSSFNGDVSRRYYIDTALREKSSTSQSGVRVTENLKHDVEVEGVGTYSNPFRFIETLLVRVGSNSIQYGKVYDIGEDENKVTGEGIEKVATLEGSNYIADFNVKPLFGHKYVGNSGCGELSKVGTDGYRYRINNITKDINCIINFSPKMIKFNLVAGIDGLATGPNPTEIYLRYSDKWYKDAARGTSITKITPPTKLGYEFLGYYYKNNTLAIKPNGEIVLTSDNITQAADDNESQELVGKWKALLYTVNYDGNGQTSGSMSPSTHYQDLKSNLSAVGYKKTGYGFLGWSRIKGATSPEYTDKGEIYNLTTGGLSITLYAVWGKCAVGTYSDGTTSTCQACPSGYTSAVGASAKNQCYISVGAGKYLTAANGTTTANCAAGTSKAAHNVNYGSTDSCPACAANTYAVAGSSSCTPCAAGYTVAAGQGKAATSCTIVVPAGKRVTAAGRAPENCAANTYASTSRTINQTQTAACTNCAAGYSSGVGATGCVDAQSPTCSLTIQNGVTIAFASKSDNVGVTSFGMGTSSSPVYNSTSSLGAYAGTFYGFVKDAAGNTGICSITARAQAQCRSVGCASYGSKQVAGGYGGWYCSGYCPGSLRTSSVSYYDYEQYWCGSTGGWCRHDRQYSSKTICNYYGTNWSAWWNGSCPGTTVYTKYEPRTIYVQ